MWFASKTVLAILLIAPAFAQDELSAARERFEAIAASAAAQVNSLDSIEWRLNQEGMTLHPQLVALRARIGAALDAAHQAIDRGDVKSAGRSTALAEDLVERLARKLGG
jgi:hypothetical protein